MPNAPERRLRTALFVDFDNFYLGLEELDQSAAKRFATDPLLWLRWLEHSLHDPDAGDGGAPTRAMLVRNCYLNPVSFGGSRAYFTRSAFRVVDCPSLAGQGKSSADVHMVMDILDALEHRTHFDEFIIMSWDTDFTPMMLRLRNHDRRTMMITAGSVAQAYEAACDRVVRGDDFIEQALSRASREPAVVIPRPSPLPSNEDLRQQILDHVAEYMEHRDAAADMASVAWSINDKFGDVVRETNWAGEGGFRLLLKSAPSFPYQTVTAPGSPGFIYDPRRHQRPDTDGDPHAFSDDEPELADLALRVSKVTGVPRLLPEEYAVLFEELAADLERDAFQLTRTSKDVRDQLSERGAPIKRSNISFVIKGIQFQGHQFGSDPEAETPERLAHIFLENVKTLCENAQMELGDEDLPLLERWIATPSEEVTEP